MEDKSFEKRVVRMAQVYAVGGTFEDPSAFTRAINKNLVILQDSDKYCKIKDIDYTIFTDPRYANAPPMYLAFITAEVDVDVTPEPEITSKKKRKQKKKKKSKR